MNDPHVERLTYRFKSRNPNDIFDAAQPWSGELGEFDARLKDSILTVRPANHYADADSARDALEPFLDDWQSVAYLEGGHDITFEYQSAEIVDRQPNPDEGEVVAEPVVLRGTVSFGVDAVIARHNSEFPAPDPGYRRSAAADAILERVRRYKGGGETLPALAYWLLTKIETEFGSSRPGQARANAASALSVDPAVLSAMGRLTAVPDPSIGRKARGDPKSLTQAELAWLEAVVIRLARRAGEYAAAATPLPPVRLTDFPSID